MNLKKITTGFLLGLLFFAECRNPIDKAKDEVTKLSVLAGLFFVQKQASQAATGTSDFDNLKTYYSTMKNLEVQVVYESGADPYTGSFTNPATSTTKTVWGIFEDNLSQIFSYKGQSISLTIPKESSSMTSITAQNKSTWTITDLTNFAKTYRTSKSTAETGRFFVAFLNGYYDDSGSANKNVIGVNVTNTPYVFIFKQVITSVTASPPPVQTATRIYVEQSTLVHEMGHALGLVNNGVSLASSHQDTSNGKHCSNTSCVMYYANTGTSALVTYLQTYLQSGSNIMLKSDCLDDIKSYKP